MEFLQSHHSTNIAESGYTLGTGLCSAVNALDLLGTEESLTTSINRHQHHQTNDNGTIGPSGNTGVTIGNIQELQSSPTDDINQETEQPIHNNNQPQVIGEFGASFWVDDMAGFPLPPLDLDPLPPGLFSPCSASYNWGCTRSDCVTRPGNPNGEGVADVLLSLKHAVVHPASPTGSYYNCSPAANHHYPQEYTQNIGPLPVGQTNFTTGPAMSVNVSMNMTMNMHPSYEVNYASAWGVEPLLSPAPQYNPIQDSQTRMNQTSANSLISSHPPVLHPHNRLQPSIDDEHALCTSVNNNNNNNNTTQSIIQDDNGRPNLCRICGKTYARPSTLKTHLRTHSGEKPFRCHACSKAFSQAANLTAHARTHSGEKPFRCPVCDRRFSQSSSVTTHMRTHSGERPYRCRFCKKAFSDSSTLTKHLRIHSGEKPYQCKLCLLRFSQSGNLNRHMRVHGVSLT